MGYRGRGSAEPQGSGARSGTGRFVPAGSGSDAPDTRIDFIQPLKERIVREVGYGLSLVGASSADLVKSTRSES
jgi:hypothetical protein